LIFIKVSLPPGGGGGGQEEGPPFLTDDDHDERNRRRRRRSVVVVMGLHRSQKMVLGLSLLFMMDAFAGGFVLQV